MADKNIVLEENEDLGKLRGGNDALKTNGISNCATFSYTGMGADGGYIEFISIRESGVTLYSEGDTLSGAHYVWIQSSGNGRYDIQIVDDIMVNETHALQGPNDDGKLIRFVRTNNVISLYVDGVFAASASWANGSPTVDHSAIGCLSRTSDSNFLKGVYSHVRLGSHTYINNGDFGSVGVPSSPAGADGTLSSPDMWWKTLANGEPIDAIYENVTVFYATLPVTPVDFHNVIDINTNAQPTNDPFYGLYTDQYLVVTVQMSAILILLLEMEMEKMKILRTIQADTIGAGVATFNQDATSLMSTGSGILRVKIGSDTAFRELTITNDGRFYPVGNIRAIDTDSPTTVDLSLVTLGFPSIYSEVVITNEV